MKNIIDYKAILDLCTSQDPLREWMNAPFRIENKVYATNAFLMVIIDAEHAPDVPVLAAKSHKDILSVLPPEIQEDAIKIIRVSDLKAELAKIPKIHDVKECEECDGEGEVFFSLVASNQKVYYKEGDCPVCNGKGKIADSSADLVYDHSKAVRISKFHFSGFTLDKIAKVAELAGVSELEILHISVPEAGVLFRISDILILAMPLFNSFGLEEVSWIYYRTIANQVK